MFSQAQLKEIQAAGFIGLPLEDVGARLKMTSKKFLKEYEIDDDAQMAYEAGRSNRKVEILTTIETQSEKEHKALDLASLIFGLKPTAATSRAKAQSNEVSDTDDSDNSLVNPLMFLNSNDEDTEDEPVVTKKKK